MKNIQHPTSNIQHPMVGVRALIGCSMLDVGCWMFREFLALTVFTLFLLASVVAQAQPETNALVQLMLTQPPTDISSPVMATATFDPPVVRPGERAVYRVTFNA